MMKTVVRPALGVAAMLALASGEEEETEAAEQVERHCTPIAECLRRGIGSEGWRQVTHRSLNPLGVEEDGRHPRAPRRVKVVGARPAP